MFETVPTTTRCSDRQTPLRKMFGRTAMDAIVAAALASQALRTFLLSLYGAPAWRFSQAILGPNIDLRVILYVRVLHINDGRTVFRPDSTWAWMEGTVSCAAGTTNLPFCLTKSSRT